MIAGPRHLGTGTKNEIPTMTAVAAWGACAADALDTGP